VSQISITSKSVCGIVLITVPTVEFGGVMLLHMLRTGDPAYINSPLREDLFRAGHAHAGVMLLFALISQFLADAVDLPGPLEALVRLAAPAAAILMPLGFFLSMAAPGADAPNGLINLVYVAAVILAAGMVTLGIALVRSARRQA
jgi:hypothetical protein